MSGTRTAVRAAEAPLLSPTEQAALARAFAIAPALTRRQLERWFAHDSTATLCRRLQRLTDRRLLVRRRLGTTRGAAPFAYGLARAGSVALYGSAVHHGSGHLGRDVYHSLGLVDFYLRLEADLREAHGELLAWWGQSAALTTIGSGRTYVNPDGAFLLAHQREQLFLLEFDRAPNAAGATRFMDKLARYRRYYDQRCYRDQFGLGALRPVLLCLFADTQRMERVRARAGAVLASSNVTLPVLFADARASLSPLSPCWRDLTGRTPCAIIDDRLF